MKSKYTYTLFTLIMVLYFVPVNAQKNTKAKKATTKADARSLGNQAAKSSALVDTAKNGGGANGANANNGGSLSEEIV
ncbi:MAG TPA: hypothetical protein VIQ77_12255, partial [Mucilaginibacter sp.]